MANHDDNARSLLFLDDILAAREEDEAVIEDFYEASTDVEDEEVGFFCSMPPHGPGQPAKQPFCFVLLFTAHDGGLCSGQTTEHMGAQGRGPHQGPKNN